MKELITLNRVSISTFSGCFLLEMILHFARDPILCALTQIGFVASIYFQVDCFEMIGHVVRYNYHFPLKISIEFTVS